MNNQPKPEVQVQHADGSITTIRQFSDALIHTKPQSLRERKPCTVTINNVADETNGDVRLVCTKVTNTIQEETM